MKTLYKLLLLSFLFTWTFSSCSDDDDETSLIKDPVINTVAPVSLLRAEVTENENELLIKWTNPMNKDVYRVEISYSTVTSRAFSGSPILVEASKGTEGEVLITVPCYDVYTISAVAINKAGIRSPKESVKAEPYLPKVTESDDKEE